MLWKSKSTHGPLLNYATRISQPVWLGVGIEDLRCCGNPSPLVDNSKENINIYISSINKHARAHSSLSSFFCPLLAAG